MRWWLPLLCVACSGPTSDPELARRRASLDAYERAVHALDSGEPEAARVKLLEALSARPEDPLLLTWRARAEADSGDLDSAIRTLQSVLSKGPGFAEARYNLACYQARSGDLDGAAINLRQALVDGARDPREVLDDPDFQPHLQRAQLQFLPKSPVEAELVGPQGSVFLGSEVRVSARVTGRKLGALDFSKVVVGGPLALVRVNEIRSVNDDAAQVTWTFRVDGPGQVPIGPLTVRVGDRTATTDEIVVLALAPPNRQPVDYLPVPLRAPSNLNRSGEDAAAWVQDGELRVRSLPGDRVAVQGALVPSVPWSYGEEASLKWTLQTWRDPGPKTRVRITRRGKTVLDAPPERL